MAGIGFQLKKLFNNKGYFYKFKAYLFSTIVTTGPVFMCTSVVVLIQILMNMAKLPYEEKELITASIVYAFVFSQIITSIFAMVISRYVSDLLYIQDYKKVNASFMGVLVLALLIGSIVAMLFYARSPLDISYKLTTYLLYMELIILWLEMVYLSALRDYIRIVKSFLYGILILLGVIALCIWVFGWHVPLSIMLGMNIGFLVIISTLASHIVKYFRNWSGEYFRFMEYFDRYVSLIFISFFYTLGIYVHNFLFWKSKVGNMIADTYIFSPTYDVAVFYAFLTVLPAMVLFVVNVETSFYDYYKNYYGLILAGGNGREIELAKKKMIFVLWQELRKLIETQFFISLLGLVIGRIGLPYLGVAGITLDLFMILTLAAYCCFMMFYMVLVLLYFEDRLGCTIVIGIFTSGVIVLTHISIGLGETYYGYGFFLASILGFGISLIRLATYLRDIDYHTYSSRPMKEKEKGGLFTLIVGYVYKENR